MNIDKIDAIKSLSPDAEVSQHGNDIIWHKPSEPSITEAEIQTELARLQAEWEAQEYARNRATAYPSTGDQLDMIYKDMKNSTTTHADAVEVVKTKYPKG